MFSKKQLLIAAIILFGIILCWNYYARPKNNLSKPTEQIGYNHYESFNQLPSSGPDRRDILDNDPFYYDGYGYYGGTYSYVYPSYPDAYYPYYRQRNYTPYQRDWRRGDLDYRYENGRYGSQQRPQQRPNTRPQPARPRPRAN